MLRYDFVKSVESFLIEDDTNSEMDITSVDADLDLWDAGLIDSFRATELLVFLEDLLNVEINFEYNVIIKFRSINIIYDLLNSQKPEDSIMNS